MDMKHYYQQIQGGKAKAKAKLEGAEKMEYLFRRQEFDYLLIREQGADDRDRENELPTLATHITKDTLL